MLNQCTLTGNLGGDPEVFYCDPRSFVEISLSDLGQFLETNHLDPSCFLLGRMECQREGGYWIAFAAVIGTLDQHRWETDEGVQRTSFQLLANTLEFIKTDGRGFEKGQDTEDIPF
jgi:single-strand DNA-binding protein